MPPKTRKDLRIEIADDLPVEQASESQTDHETSSQSQPAKIEKYFKQQHIKHSVSRWFTNCELEYIGACSLHNTENCRDKWEKRWGQSFRVAFWTGLIVIGIVAILASMQCFGIPLISAYADYEAGNISGASWGIQVATSTLGLFITTVTSVTLSALYRTGMKFLNSKLRHYRQNRELKKLDEKWGAKKLAAIALNLDAESEHIKEHKNEQLQHILVEISEQQLKKQNGFYKRLPFVVPDTLNTLIQGYHNENGMFISGKPMKAQLAFRHLLLKETPIINLRLDPFDAHQPLASTNTAKLIIEFIRRSSSYSKNKSAINVPSQMDEDIYETHNPDYPIQVKIIATVLQLLHPSNQDQRNSDSILNQVKQINPLIYQQFFKDLQIQTIDPDDLSDGCHIFNQALANERSSPQAYSHTNYFLNSKTKNANIVFHSPIVNNSKICAIKQQILQLENDWIIKRTSFRLTGKKLLIGTIATTVAISTLAGILVISHGSGVFVPILGHFIPFHHIPVAPGPSIQHDIGVNTNVINDIESIAFVAVSGAVTTTAGFTAGLISATGKEWVTKKINTHCHHDSRWARWTRWANAYNIELKEWEDFQYKYNTLKEFSDPQLQELVKTEIARTESPTLKAKMITTLYSGCRAFIYPEIKDGKFVWENIWDFRKSMKYFVELNFKKAVNELIPIWDIRHKIAITEPIYPTDASKKAALELIRSLPPDVDIRAQFIDALLANPCSGPINENENQIQNKQRNYRETYELVFATLEIPRAGAIISKLKISDNNKIKLVEFILTLAPANEQQKLFASSLITNIKKSSLAASFLSRLMEHNNNLPLITEIINYTNPVQLNKLGAIINNWHSKDAAGLQNLIFNLLANTHAQELNPHHPFATQLPCNQLIITLFSAIMLSSANLTNKQKILQMLFAAADQHHDLLDYQANFSEFFTAILLPTITNQIKFTNHWPQTEQIEMANQLKELYQQRREFYREIFGFIFAIKDREQAYHLAVAWLETLFNSATITPKPKTVAQENTYLLSINSMHDEEAPEVIAENQNPSLPAAEIVELLNAFKVQQDITLLQSYILQKTTEEEIQTIVATKIEEQAQGDVEQTDSSTKSIRDDEFEEIILHQTPSDKQIEFIVATAMEQLSQQQSLIARQQIQIDELQNQLEELSTTPLQKTILEKIAAEKIEKNDWRDLLEANSPEKKPDRLNQIEQNLDQLNTETNAEEKQESNYQQKILKEILDSESLKIFYRQFQLKLNELLLAYKAISSGQIKHHTGIKGILIEKISLISPAIKIGFELIEIPFVGVLSEIIASAIEKGPDIVVELYAHKKAHTDKFISKLFVSTTEMEQQVEIAARKLALIYRPQLEQLTAKGSKDLANCAVRRIIEALRAYCFTEDEPFAQQILAVIATFHSNQGFLPFTSHKIETANHARVISLTDTNIFQETGIKITNEKGAIYYHSLAGSKLCAKPQLYGYREADNEYLMLLSQAGVVLQETSYPLRLMLDSSKPLPLETIRVSNQQKLLHETKELKSLGTEVEKLRVELNQIRQRDSRHRFFTESLKYSPLSRPISPKL